MKEVRLAQYVMGTIVEVTVSAERGEANARDAAACALCEFECIERIFSRYDPASELSRVNALAASEATPVSDAFYALTTRGLEYSRHSAGAFSITLQPLIALWERASETGRMPDVNQIEAALWLAAPERVIHDAARRTIRFAEKGTSFNLDGLAKGYASDRARAVLLEHGSAHATINAGSSSISVLQPEENETPWRLLVAHPHQAARSVAGVWLNQPAVSTSGTGGRGFTLGRHWFSHVLDPLTGLPLEELASATALGEYAEILEVASKILLLRGCAEGLRVCDRLGWSVEGLTVRQQASGHLLAIEYPQDLPLEVTAI
jgi:thiamine biosynthesis lipoprotein